MMLKVERYLELQFRFCRHFESAVIHFRNHDPEGSPKSKWRNSSHPQPRALMLIADSHSNFGTLVST